MISSEDYQSRFAVRYQNLMRVYRHLLNAAGVIGQFIIYVQVVHPQYVMT